MIEFDDICEFAKNPPKLTAWGYLQSIKQEFGRFKVSDELYCWYTYDAFTISYRETAVFRLLGLPEWKAMLVLYNVRKKLLGEGMPWHEFTLKFRGEKYVRTRGGRIPDPEEGGESPDSVAVSVP